MRTGLLISLAMWAAIIAAYGLASGCAVLPSVTYCDKVEYSRTGTVVVLYAECSAPAGPVMRL